MQKIVFINVCKTNFFHNTSHCYFLLEFSTHEYGMHYFKKSGVLWINTLTRHSTV